MIRDIRAKQRLLVELLSTKAYKDGTMKESTKLLLDETIKFCAEYERSKRPFNCDTKDS